MKKDKRLSPILSGVAGEYLVAGELTRRGCIASITLRNTKGVDILVSNEDTSRTIGIQVKTNQDNAKWWLLGQKAEAYFADNLFYVFVNLKNSGQPGYYIVPSKIVADFVKKNYENWLNTPGKNGQKHNDTSMRQFKDKEERYLNRWDLLELE